MTISHGGLKLAVCAVVGALGLAACSQGSSSSNSVSSTSGGFGSVPAASGTAHAGTITWASSTNQFEFEMWRPLYWFTNGVQPIETPSMSMADEPVYSNGDKTITIRMKTNYRWSDGQPVTSKDALFFLDEVRAAVKESGANWSQYTPDVGIPDQIVSATTPSSTTLVINLNKPVNPLWMTDNELQLIQPMPAHVWAKASASGPILDFTNPANAKKIFDFLNKESGSTGTYATNPLWQGVGGEDKMAGFKENTGGFSMV
jgi:peptide/nickel transport system substrate-binding protein